jgi:hypothetical protein
MRIGNLTCRFIAAIRRSYDHVASVGADDDDDDDDDADEEEGDDAYEDEGADVNSMAG